MQTKSKIEPARDAAMTDDKVGRNSWASSLEKQTESWMSLKRVAGVANANHEERAKFAQAHKECVAGHYFIKGWCLACPAGACRVRVLVLITGDEIRHFLHRL
jgi:hypothetical protein